MIKRMFEVIIAATILLMLLPFMLLLAVLILLSTGRPVLFRQQRPGRQGIAFSMVKFRTMNNHLDANNTLISDEQRLHRFGRFLRASSLDELPELWNVLKGDMSLVGPRPLLMEYLPLYSDIQARRHEVRPGITGWAQVNGRNALSWEEKFALDVWYVDNQRFLLDLKILWMTLGTVMNRKGISQPGLATMAPFKGGSIDSASDDIEASNDVI